MVNCTYCNKPIGNKETLYIDIDNNIFCSGECFENHAIEQRLKNQQSQPRSTVKVTLTHVTDNPVQAMEEAASNCYNSEPTEDGKIFKNCIRTGHTSISEFAVFQFHISGVSRSLLAQLTRHRMANYAVRSQRYVDEDNAGYVVPKTIGENKEALRVYNETQKRIQWCYSQLKFLGIPNEDARYILSNACETTLDVAFNLRSLMNFMNERLCSRAQREIRELANLMKEEVVKRYPELKEFLVPKCERYIKYTFCPESKSCGKHKKLSEIYEKSEEMND